MWSLVKDSLTIQIIQKNLGNITFELGIQLENHYISTWKVHIYTLYQTCFKFWNKPNKNQHIGTCLAIFQLVIQQPLGLLEIKCLLFWNIDTTTRSRRCGHMSHHSFCLFNIFLFMNKQKLESYSFWKTKVDGFLTMSVKISDIFIWETYVEDPTKHCCRILNWSYNVWDKPNVKKYLVVSIRNVKLTCKQHMYSHHISKSMQMNYRCIVEITLIPDILQVELYWLSMTYATHTW